MSVRILSVYHLDALFLSLVVSLFIFHLMTFQQLEYIIAVDKSRHFVKAATECGVSQSTLSMAINKLEQEIDVAIFDRSKHPIEPTPMGKIIIQQAEIILHNSAQLRALVQDEKEDLHGQLLLGMVPSVAPVLYPQFGRVVATIASNLQVHIHEHGSQKLIDQLQRSELDMIFINTADIKDTNLLSIELWTERFLLYAAEGHPLHNRESIRPEELLDGNVWTLRSFHDHYPQLTEITHQETMRRTYLESGSLQTLIAAVDVNAGFTLLPESFASCLSTEQRKGLHRINSGKYFRTISLAIRPDYMRERMLNIVTNTVKRIIPRELLASQIANFEKVKL